MLVLKGSEVAKKKRQELKLRVDKFCKQWGRPPGLAVAIVGEDPASHVYVKNKIKACNEVGIESFHHPLAATITERDLLNQVEAWNKRTEVDGILVQLPLPPSISDKKVLKALDPKKDPDGLTSENLGLLFSGQTRVAPCTPSGVIEIFKHYDISIAGKNAVVVGRSNIVGKPMAQLLLQNHATVTVAHSKTVNLSDLTKRADIVVVAAGRPEMLGKSDFKKDSVVIDVGIHRTDQGLCGDVRFKELEGHVYAATPVPGGVGPMTIAMLLENTLVLAELNTKKN